jgi:hypothetical protein
LFAYIIYKMEHIYRIIIGVVLIIGLSILKSKMFQEGFRMQRNDVQKNLQSSLPGDFPRADDLPILDQYPYTGNKEASNNSASDIWWHYPIFSLGSFRQLTNNLRYRYNPDEGTCMRSDMCGALYKNIKSKPNEIHPLPPAEEGPGARVGYWRSEPNILYYSIPTNENILY